MHLPLLEPDRRSPADPEGCPAGGTQLQLGPDTNLNGILDPEIATLERYLHHAETPPQTRIETVTLPGGLPLLIHPFIVTRGQSETVVVEPSHELPHPYKLR